MQQGGERWQARRAVEGFAAHDVVVLTLLLHIQAQQHVQLNAGDLGPPGCGMTAPSGNPLHDRLGVSSFSEHYRRSDPGRQG